MEGRKIFTEHLLPGGGVYFKTSKFITAQRLYHSCALFLLLLFLIKECREFFFLHPQTFHFEPVCARALASL